MRTGSQVKRPRSRSHGHGNGPNGNSGNGNGSNGGNGGNHRKQVSLRHQTIDSNGPEIRVRGNPFQVHEKYLALARDASSSGDRIAAENYYQHAEHYFRIINASGEAPQYSVTPNLDVEELEADGQASDTLAIDGLPSDGQASNGQASDARRAAQLNADDEAEATTTRVNADYSSSEMNGNGSLENNRDSSSRDRGTRDEFDAPMPKSSRGQASPYGNNMGNGAANAAAGNAAGGGRQGNSPRQHRSQFSRHGGPGGVNKFNRSVNKPNYGAGDQPVGEFGDGSVSTGANRQELRDQGGRMTRSMDADMPNPAPGQRNSHDGDSAARVPDDAVRSPKTRTVTPSSSVTASTPASSPAAGSSERSTLSLRKIEAAKRDLLSEVEPGEKKSSQSGEPHSDS